MGPLSGMRVVDLADVRGELCGRVLADLGADVVRVEPPGGARSRRLAPESAAYARGRPSPCLGAGRHAR